MLQSVNISNDEYAVSPIKILYVILLVIFLMLPVECNQYKKIVSD